MVSVSRRLVFLTAAALLTASGIFTLGIQAERATQTAPSSTIAAAVLKGLQWRSVGPPRAGRTIAASGVKGRPKEAYSGQTGGGLWKTIDGGATWAPVTDGRSTAHRSARSPSRSPIPTPSSSAWASRASAATSSRATASTSRPTPARPGRTSASRTRRRSPRFASIRPIPTSSTSRRSESTAFRATSAASTRAPTAARAGRRRCSATTRPAASTSQLIRTIPTSSSRRCGRPTASSTRCPAAGRAAAFSSRPTAARRGPRSPAGRGCRRRSSGRSASRCQARTASRVYAIVEAEKGGLFSSDDAGNTWKLVNDGRNIRQRAFYYTHVAADPHDKDVVYALNVGTFRSTDGGKTMVERSPAATRTTSGSIPTTRTTSCTRTTAAARCRSTRQRRSGTWTDARLSDGSVLPRGADPTRAVSRLRRAAGRSTICVPSDTGVGGGGRGGGGGGRGGAPATYSAGGAETGYIAPDPKDLDVFFAGRQQRRRS